MIGDLSSNPSPEEQAGFFSIITFSWLNPMLRTGYKRPLEQSDLFTLMEKEHSSVISDRFHKAWNSAEEFSSAKDGDYTQLPQDQDESQPPTKHPSLSKTLSRAFGASFYVAAIFKLINDLLTFTGPLLLPYLLRFLDSSRPLSFGLYLVAALFFGALLQSVCLHQYFHRCFRVGMQLRGAVVCAIYQKALRRDAGHNSNSRIGTGQVVTLMSVDAQRLQDLLPYLHMVWSAPLQIAISMYLLWGQIGVASLAGLGSMILLIPVNTMLAKRLKTFQTQLMKVKDERIKITNEVFSSIKVIKLYAWEMSFGNKITRIRNEELALLRAYVMVYSLQSLFWVASPILIAVSSFVAFSLGSDQALTASRAFTTLALFNVLRFPVSMLPFVVNNMVEASVSISRITQFLISPEIQRGPLHILPPEDEHALILDKATFTWDDSHNFPAVSNVSLSIKRGELCMVSGRTASGKTALIESLLGELEQTEGSRSVSSSVAYTSQIPWIQNASVRDNILFGREYDQQWMETVVRVCALGPDLAILPAGEFTEVGERGINLSGGQKHRIALARAVYQDSLVYLLDDPLSAVDSHVSKHIFDECIGKVLGDKTVVLVTNNSNLLEYADRVLFVDKGTVKGDGKFDQLMEENTAFREYVQSLSEEEEEERQSDEEKEEHIPSFELGRKQSIDSDTSQHSTSSGKPPSTSVPAQAKQPNSGVLIQDEHREQGHVSLQVYIKYAIACGGILLAIFVLTGLLLSTAAQFVMTRWLAYWSEHDGQKSDLYFVGIYGLIGGAVILFRFIATLVFSLSSVRAARVLHETLLKALFSAKMSFFDTTPLGRILNRFSKDQYTIDEKLASAIFSYLTQLFAVISIIFAICYVTPLFTIMLIPLGALYYQIQRFYIANSRELQRLDSINRSPVFSHFSETLQGVSVIRAFGASERFQLTNEHHLDISLRAYYPYVASNRWLAIRNEFIGACVVAFAALFAVLSRHKVSSSMAGLSITYALSVTQTLNWMVRMTSERETNIVSVERNIEFSSVPQEAESFVKGVELRDSWPETGKIQIQSVSMRYRPDLDLVLKDLSCTIEGGHSVGVVGRTGAGKSSFLLALLRLVEYHQGRILIDGVDIQKIGLFQLRSKVSIIPQDPVLFTGSVRFNLDPFQSYPDHRLWQVLEHSHLKEYVKQLPGNLDYVITEGGSNLSVGQRQLLCLSRALLRNSKLILMDEATSSVSRDIEMLIQDTIKTQFKGCTLIVIAHRLATVLDSDIIMVMGDGRIVEMGSPHQLMADKESEFYALVKSMEMEAQKRD